MLTSALNFYIVVCASLLISGMTFLLYLYIALGTILKWLRVFSEDRLEFKSSHTSCGVFLYTV